MLLINVTHYTPSNSRFFALLIVFALIAACSSPSEDDSPGGEQTCESCPEANNSSHAQDPTNNTNDNTKNNTTETVHQTAVRPLTRWGASTIFFDRPFPCDTRLLADGRVDLDEFPNPRRNRMVIDILNILKEDVRGFGRSSSVYIPFDGALDSDSLPGLLESIEPSSSVFLIDVDADSSDYGRRFPVDVFFDEDWGQYGAPNLLSVLPLQGIPLQPNVRYAVVVTNEVRTKDAHHTIAPSVELSTLLEGKIPPEMDKQHAERYLQALENLRDLEVSTDTIIALTVFTTGDPTHEMVKARDNVLNMSTPTLEPWTYVESFESYCVVQSAIEMPVFQEGEPPFQNKGGNWVRDEDGNLVLQSTERARILATIPRRSQPEGGWPTVLFVRTGGGGDRPLIDRGKRAEPGGEAIEPGSGYAEDFAAAGFAALSVDGPHGGFRNISDEDEQFLMFNIVNPVAMRDNIRQSALELILFASLIDTLEIDPALCPEHEDFVSGKHRFSTENLVLMGHSMGATIAPLVLANTTAFDAAILSGAGGSWIANLIHKQQPLETRPLAEIALGYLGDRRLHEHDIALTLLQWAGEAADPPLFADAIVQSPVAPEEAHHILMFQGIADNYILPPMANALTLPLGLDLAGPLLDTEHPVTSEFTSISELLPLVKRLQIDLPARRTHQDVTAVLVQHLEDGVEDGHEVVFQLEGPKHQVRCFLETLVAGTPTVVDARGRWDECD